MHGWMGCCTHPREFPLKDSETKLGNFSLKRLPSPPPPHTRLWPSRFLGWGNFLRPLHLRWGRFRFCRDSRRRRGRTVGVPVTSFPRRGDPSSLPRPPGSRWLFALFRLAFVVLGGEVEGLSLGPPPSAPLDSQGN